MRLFAVALVVDAAILAALAGVVTVLSVFRLRLIRNSPPLDATTDIRQWAAGVSGKPGHAVVDSHGVSLAPSHPVVLCACILLCANASGGVLSLAVMWFDVLDSSWNALPMVFLVVGLVVITSALPAVERVRELHAWADRRSQFFTAVDALLRGRYGCSERHGKALNLIGRVCGLLTEKEMGVIMDTANLSGAETALHEMFQTVQNKKVNGANWIWQLAPEEIELLRELIMSA
mgnify:CR=1 FL=1